jgi:hypothetical protein
MANFELDPQGFTHIKGNTASVVKQVLEDIADDARRLVPKDTMELHDSIEVAYREGATEGAVVVGTDHWAATEYGSEPHIIEAKGNYSLHNPETGEYYGRVVNHPGTPEQPFLRPSLYKRRKIEDVD